MLLRSLRKTTGSTTKNKLVVSYFYWQLRNLKVNDLNFKILIEYFDPRDQFVMVSAIDPLYSAEI